MYRIMLVDDEPNILNALKRIFKKETDLEIETYESAYDALKRAKTSLFDMFISDYRMPEMDGVSFLNETIKLQPESVRIILSGHTDLDALLGAINEAQIYRFITKPWSDYELVSTVKQALEYRDIFVENRRLANTVREQVEELQNRKSVLEKLEEKHPVLVEVEWASDGSIIIDEKGV